MMTLTQIADELVRAHAEYQAAQDGDETALDRFWHLFEQLLILKPRTDDEREAYRVAFTLLARHEADIFAAYPEIAPRLAVHALCPEREAA